MATYFNYVEREADSYVNWADVGRDMSATIDDIQRVREEKKALIEKTYREDLKFIQDNPSGEHETMNSWSLGVAQSSAEMMRLQNTMLKQGKLSLPNYLTFRQNITDSVEKIYTVNSQLQEAFKEVNDRTKENANQQLERETKVLLEKYGKLQDTEAYINPLNGTIYLGLTEIVEEDGKSVRKLKKGEGTYLSPDQLQAAAMQKFDNFDEQPVLDTWVEGLGDVQVDLREIGGETLAGLITSVTDITNETILQKAEEIGLTEAQMAKLKDFVTNFNKAETDFINGVLNNKYDALALATEKIKINPETKQPYNIVFNKADQKTSNDIYVDKTDSTFTPEISKKQQAVLSDYLKKQLRAKYDRKVEMQPYNEPREVKERPIYQQPTDTQTKIGLDRDKAKNFGNVVGNLYSGNLGDREAALRTIRNADRVQSAWFSEDKDNKYVNVLTKEGKLTRHPFLDKNTGQPINVKRFGTDVGSAVYGDELVTTYLNDFESDLVNKHSIYSKTWGDDATRDVETWTKAEVPTDDLLEEFKKEKFADSDLYWGTGNKKGAELLNTKLEKYGITAVPNGYYGIDIKDKDGNVLKSISVDSSKTNRDQYFTLLKDAVEKHLRKPQQQSQQQETPKSPTKPGNER